MKKGKRAISLFVAAVMAVSLFTACQKSGGTGESTSTEGNSEGKVSGKLVIWEHGSNFEEPLKELIGGFQKQYPDVEVEYEVKATNYYNLLNTAIQSGEAPDIFWTNGSATAEMANLVDQDVIYDLTDQIDTKDLAPESLNIATINDKIYSVPWMSYDTRACYYNKDIFKEMGLEIPKTFSEFEEILAKIKGNGKIPISLAGIDTWSILFFFEPLLAAMEPEYCKGLVDYTSKANDPRVGTTIEKALEWADKGYFGEGYLGVDGDGQNLAFTKGEAVMTITGSWMATAYAENNPDLNYGAFQIPDENGKRGLVGAYANGFSIYKKTKSLDAATAFIDYCTTLEAQSNWVNKLGAVSGSDKIESSNEIAKQIAQCDEKYISWQSNLSKYNLEGKSATTIWEEDSVKIFSKSLTVDELLKNIGEVMQ